MFLATLATPTDTSDLYEFSLQDMSQLYETKLFRTEEAAIAWAHARVEEENRFTWNSETEEWAVYHGERTEQRPDGPVRFLFWTKDAGDKVYPESSFVLRIAAATLED